MVLKRTLPFSLSPHSTSRVQQPRGKELVFFHQPNWEQCPRIIANRGLGRVCAFFDIKKLDRCIFLLVLEFTQDTLIYTERPLK